jgi:RsiW-degrading membrane proteinase PrsW (M82 family)
MTLIVAALFACAIIPAVIVLWYCICSLNEMDAQSPHGPRIAIALIAGGVFAQFASVMAGTIPTTSDILLLTGLAVLVRINCRKNICPCVTFPSTIERRRIPK